MEATIKKPIFIPKVDPRYTVFLLLLTYNVLGITVLGFNRSPTQMLLTVFGAVGFQYLYNICFKLPMANLMSASITGLGLCLLINYGHNPFFALFPVFLAISTKFIFTFNNRHIYNPGLMGVVLSLVITNEFISPAPAYQWNGIGAMSLFIAMPAVLFVMPGINRTPIVVSFLLTYLAQITIRSLMIKHYLPWETLVLGTITSPPFFLFTFFMLTDPSTSPSAKGDQIKAGILLGVLDLIFHLFSSYHTFFYAAGAIGTYKLFKLHGSAIWNAPNKLNYLNDKFFKSGHYQRVLLTLAISLVGLGVYRYYFVPKAIKNLDFKMKLIPASQTSFNFSQGELLTTIDPRIQHMGKWITAITDGVATADVNNDGLIDVFFTNAHKSRADRGALFLNQGDFIFKRFDLGSEAIKFQDIRKYGAPANPYFVDMDSDGDLDLFVSYAFGKEGTSRLFLNELNETGKLNFSEITDEVGLREFSNSATANFVDLNNDGLLEIIVGNTIATHLDDYKTPAPLDLFELPKAEYEGDRRMFNFMHASWHMANNGAINKVYLNKGTRFEKLSPELTGIDEKRWTMAIGTADFNKDGLTDLYFANDFGPDNLYLNKGNNRFINMEGRLFGTIGKDTYKGMNATIGDFDQNGYQDIYISNVHHSLQAEGSLLWTFSKGNDDFFPEVSDQATNWGALNENRFGWGATAVDFNNDGYLDLAQANGMVDDAYDKKHEKCPDYWYVNEKLARSPPSIHRYIDAWGDIRGMCIHGKEKNRIYLNRGKKHPRFVDVAEKVGLDQIGNWRGMAAADFNNDGKMDLIASSLFRNPLVFENTGGTKNWIGLDLVSKHPNCHISAQGSEVIVEFLDEKKQLQKRHIEKTIVNGFSAQSDNRIHLGLGNGKLQKVTVNWCRGLVKREYKFLKTNQYQKLILKPEAVSAL